MSTDIKFIDDPEFKKLEEHGFTSEYVHMEGTNPRYIKPIISLEGALSGGWFPKGTKVRWIDSNGFDYQRDRAREKIGTNRTLTVKSCNIGGSSSTYEFEEIEGRWNSVMFEKIEP